jgi:single-strand DNA-binding protein
MADLRIPIVGTVLTQPERRVIEKSGSVVTSFRIVMNYRRYDKASDTWIDSGMFRVRVNCWRRLADHVYASLNVGDPVIVVGRIFTRDWSADSGELRVNYEVEADAVGHDLSRGTTTFTKTSVAGPQSTVEDEESENRIGGELSYPVDANGRPVGPDAEEGSEIAAETAADAMAILHGAGLDGTTGGEDDEDEELVGAGAGARRRRGR